MSLTAAWLLASCSGAHDLVAPVTGAQGAAVASVVVTPTASSLPVGGSIPLRAEAHDAAGGLVAGTTIFWSSSDTTVAVVSSAGVVTARAVGSAQVAASAAGQSAVATITVVPVPVASVAVVPGSGTVSVGATMSLTAVAYDSAGRTLSGRPVTWASGTPGVASVDAKGSVTGVSAGTAQITATVGGRSGGATITVALAPVAAVAVTPGSLALTVGQVGSLTAVATDAAGNVLPGRGVSWTSSNAGIATVNGSGLVTAIGVGSASITATSEGKTATVPVVVAAAPVAPPPPPAPVASVLISPANASVTVGGGITLVATTTDAQGNVLAGRTVTWVSSAPQIASVDASGTVRGVARGSATITAASEGKAATAQITVNAPPTPPPAPVASVTLTPGSATLIVGSTTVLTATTRDADGDVLAGRSIAWLTSNAMVATVSAGGTVTAVGPGTATISAVSEGKSGGATITVNPPAPVPVASITLTPATATLTPGGAITLGAALFDAAHNALTGRTVTWTSSAPGIATVNASGTVTAVATGTATITAASEGVTATAQITVNPTPAVPVATVAVSPATVTLVTGNTARLASIARDAGGNVLTGRAVTWTSSAPGIATVSAAGVVTGVAPGTATVTATVEGRVGSATITVTPVPVASVAVTPTTVSLVVGNTASLAAVTRDASGNRLTGRTVTWSSSAPSIATVAADGTVSAVAPGTATITATSEGKSGTATVTVTPVPVASVTVSPATLSLDTGATGSLTATVRDARGNVLTGRPVSWSSSDADVATVSTTGVVTAVGAGTATITASSGGQSGTATVTVTAPPPPPPPPPTVDHVVVTPATLQLTPDATHDVTAQVYDSGGHRLDGYTVQWSTSDDHIVTVSATGALTAQVRARRSGSATITATTGGKRGSLTVAVTSSGGDGD